MKVLDPRYKNQGVHVISNIFTIDKGIIKVLLIKRKYDPYKDKWSLVSGALYNDEDIVDGLNREIKEKTGLTDIENILVGVYGDIKRSPAMRMVGISYIGLIDRYKVEINKETLKTVDADWYCIDDVPKDLAFDHNKVLIEATDKLKKLVLETNILKSLYPNGFTIPEIQKVYESILNKKLDRRNFRKKIIGLDFVRETDETSQFAGKKKARVYKFI